MAKITPRSSELNQLVPRHRGFDSLTPARWSCRLGICSTHFGAGFFGCEHPIDAGALGIAPALPSGSLGDQPRVACDAPIEALAGQEQAAKSSAARRAVTFTLRHGRFTSMNTNRFAVPLRRYSQS